MVSPEEVLASARECKRQRPQITEDELRAFLEAKFIGGVDPLAEALARGVMVGAINNPVDWLWGLSSILGGMARLWQSSGSNVAAIKDIIDGVVRILT